MERDCGNGTGTNTYKETTSSATTIRYILDNSVNGGLAKDPADYPFVGSDCYTFAELIQQAAPR